MIRSAALLLALLPSLVGCYTSPISGKRSFIALPAEQDNELGAMAYGELLAAERVITSGAQAAMVDRVVGRLVEVVERDGLSPAPFDWEVTLLDNDQMANAFCLPGGKMAVYTGILPLTQNEAGLAAVMGHEIAHALARHGAERISAQYAKETGLQLLSVLLPDLAGSSELVSMVVEMGVLMPFGRQDELEADEIGVILMARAGYDPHEAVAFWERMSAGSSGATPELLSTHPSHGTRIQQLNDLLPRALGEYEAARGL